jgi:hypothetical protein
MRVLLDALARLFIDEGQRIVFWHGPAHEFIDFMNRLPFLTFDHTTVQIIRLERVGGLEAKIRLERDDPGCRKSSPKTTARHSPGPLGIAVWEIPCIL